MGIHWKKKVKILKKGVVPYLLGKPYMTHLWITRRCNVHCKFCYLRDYSGKDPSLEELGLRLDKMKELGNRLTVIMGGETTLREDLPEIIGACDQRGMFSYLVTNGTKLNKKLIDKLGEQGLDAISVSLDTLKMGNNPLVKYNRQEYKPEDRLKTLKYAEEKYGMAAFLAIVVTKLNADEIIPIIKLADKYGIFVTITAMMNPYCISDVKDKTWEKEKGEVVFGTKKEIETLAKLMGKLKEMKKEGYRILEPDAYFDRVINFNENKGTNFCNAGKSFFDINTDGNLMLCVASDPVKLHYSELTKRNFKEKMKAFRDKQQSSCLDKCLLAAYYDTSYYAKNLIELLRTIKRIYP